MNIARGVLPLLIVLLISPAPVLAPALAKTPTANVSAEIRYKAMPPGLDAPIAVLIDVPRGYHVQSHTPLQPNLKPLIVTMDPNSAAEFSDPLYPTGVDHTYDMLGTMNVNTDRVIVYVVARIKPTAPPGPLKLTGTVQYQMCDERACFQPQKPKFEVTTNVIAAGQPPEPNQPELFAGFKPAPASQPTTTIAATPQMTSGWSIWSAFGAAIVAGLLFNIMPCVLPVLPLKAAAFHRAAENHRGRSMLLGLAFSVGIIAVFAVLAVLVLVLRLISWGSLFSNPLFIWSIVVVLIVCAAGMFGMFTFALPNALYSVDPRQDTIGGNVVFGAFAAILATPCTAPLLPPLLLWASARPAYVGVPAMLLVGVGMALPYLLLSATPELARKFPRTGPWSELFKQMMGFLLLASAAYFAGGRLIHGPGFWWLVVAVVAVASFYLIARTVQLSPNARPVAIATTLAVVMLGGALWWTARINGLASPASAGAASSFAAYSDERFKTLRGSGKPVLVKFTANWCATCQYIEGTVFRDAQVWDALRAHNITPLKVDLTDEDAPGKDLLLSLNPAGGIPLTAIYFPGREQPIVLASVYTTQELLTALNQAPAP